MLLQHNILHVCVQLTMHHLHFLIYSWCYISEYCNVEWSIFSQQELNKISKSITVEEPAICWQDK